MLSVGIVYAVGINLKLFPFMSQDIAKRTTSTAVAEIKHKIKYTIGYNISNGKN
jgi:hypothetical protein